MAAKKKQKILFFVNSDYGQANIFLATAFAIMQIAPDVELHIASFRPLEDAVKETSKQAQEARQNGKGPIQQQPKEKGRGITFHPIKGISQFEASFRPEVGVQEAFNLTPGLINSARNILILPGIMMPWGPDEFMEIYRNCELILDRVQPDMAVVDPLFSPGLTLCRDHQCRRGLKWTVLAPNTIKDFAIPLQPRLAMLWKYPIVCSALSFPLPLHQIPHNILLNLVAGYMLITDTRVRTVSSYLQQELGREIGLITANELGVLKAAPPGLRIICSSSPELDYPFTVLPNHIVPCGPIIRAAQSIGHVAPDLQRWLSRGPTVYVNLGTHLTADATEAVGMARAFHDLFNDALDTRYGTELQILWKLKRKPSGVSQDDVNAAKDPNNFTGPWKGIRDILGHKMDEDRVRITDWIAAEPKSVLESGHVICSVNHGGASSFNEAICAGVPQVLLPAWADCYDFANRVELLRVGRWANKKAKPRWRHLELSTALREVLIGPQAEEIRKNARRLAERFPENVGRDRAATELLDEMNGV